MITISFLAGSLTTVVDEQEVMWMYFAILLAIGFAGVAMVRIAIHKTSHTEGRLALNMQNIEQSLSKIVENMAALNKEAETINAYDVRHRIDELFTKDLDSFVDTRKSIAQVHGLQAYADVMNFFAAGQRYLNRVWSASADGYVDEVRAYLKASQTQFSQALKNVSQLGKQTPPS